VVGGCGGAEPRKSLQSATCITTAKGRNTMFKKFAADITGMSDVGQIIAPSDFNKTDADDYVMHEDGERIIFLIKTKSDEYCFTNLAFLHLDGTSAVSSKRVLYRKPYYRSVFKDVLIETAGRVDLDVEIKFSLGGQAYSIDVDKQQLEPLKDLYKALSMIAEMQYESTHQHAHSEEAFKAALAVLSNSRPAVDDLPDALMGLSIKAYTWLEGQRQALVVRDYGAVFDRYLHA
jgi:hypothetical protein